MGLGRGVVGEESGETRDGIEAAREEVSGGCWFEWLGTTSLVACFSMPCRSCQLGSC